MSTVERPTLDQQVTFLYTTDLQRAADFYQRVFRLPLVLDQGACRIYRVSGDAFLGICQRSKTPPTTDGVIFTFVTQNVDGWYRFLTDQGVVFEKPPAFNPNYNIYHCFLRDPDGYLLEIQTFRDPLWPNA